jgi:hypothetical protein
VREKEKKRKGKERKEKGNKKEGYGRHFILSSTLHRQEKLFCQTFSQNGFSSIEKAAPPEESEPKPFSKETEPCQTCS